jgi:hypothetical protein
MTKTILKVKGVKNEIYIFRTTAHYPERKSSGAGVGHIPSKRLCPLAFEGLSDNSNR